MIKHDIHVHTHLSSCASRDAFINGYIQNAKEIGLSIIGFADHAWDETVSGASEWYKAQPVSRLLSRKEEIKNIEVGDLKVIFGAEGEYANVLLGISENACEFVDYLIIPHSHTHMRGFVLPTDCIGNPEKHANYLVNSFISLCLHQNRDLFFGIAHPMSPVGMTIENIEIVYSFITDSMLDECASAAKESGIFLEANLSTINKIPPEARENLCIKRFYDSCKRAGCNFYLGSDAHNVQTHKYLHDNRDVFIKAFGLDSTDFTVAQR
ncbi:MAG: PHP domain-containing protein, partial [Clostridia bacterium]|nr:PHP domain-containing protein [Clostridia bacterium]